MCDQIHKFEAAGLGKAPFKYIGMVAQDIRYGERVLSEKGGVTVTTKPGGTCAYCGTYIVDMFNVRSADGKVFHVGSDCIGKAGDEGLKKIVKKEVAKRNTEKRHAREAAKIAAGIAKLESVRALLAAKPHPNEYRAKQGATLADWADWMLSNAGTAGKLAVCRVIDTAAE